MATLLRLSCKVVNQINLLEVRCRPVQHPQHPMACRYRVSSETPDCITGMLVSGRDAPEIKRAIKSIVKDRSDLAAFRHIYIYSIHDYSKLELRK